MSKLKLNIEELTDDFFEDTRLLGIIASIKNYQFCWHLNTTLGFNFRLNPDIEIQMKKKQRSYFFHVYEHKVRNCFLSHYLYHNHYDGEYLLPEFKHMDFLWLMKGDWVSEEECSGIQQSLKLLNGVQLVTELTNEMIKNKDHLVF